MPLPSNLPTNYADGDPGHSDAHDLTNTRVNAIATEVNAHEAATTSVHGIANTAALATSSALAAGLATKADTPHGHAAGDVTSGTISPTRLGSGTPSSTTFLRGDQTWATPAGGGGSGTVTSVTAADGTIVVGGTSDAPTVAVGTGLAQSKVTNLVSDLAAKQPLDSDLTAIAGLTATTDNFLQAKSSAWASRTPTQVAADLVTPLSSSLQPIDADLTAIAGLTPSNDDVVQRKAGAWTNRTPAQVKTDLSLAKGDVGLGNVDNTSDANKPVSTAAQTALNLKAALTVTDALDARLDKFDNPTVTLTDASTVVIDATAGPHQKVTVAGNRTIGKPSGGYGGQILVLTITQDATGSRVWTLHTDYRVPTGVTVTPSGTANAQDKLVVQYDSGADKWDVLGFLRGDGDTVIVAKRWRSGDQTIGGFGDVGLNTDVFMLGGTAASGSGISVPVAGLYLCVAAIHVKPGDPGGGARNGIFNVNGTTVQEFGLTVASGEVRLSASAMVVLAAADVVTLALFQNGDTGVVGGGAAKDTSLAVRYIGSAS